MENLLKDKTLLKTQGFINGKWIDAEKTFPVYNPATNEVVVDMADFGASETESAINVAEKTFKSWRKVSGEKRAALILKFVKLMEENVDDLALLLSLENGKSISDAKSEVVYSAETSRWFAEEAKRIQGQYVHLPLREGALL